MKICLINNLYPPYDKGGAGKIVAMTAEGLQGLGLDVFVISCSSKKDLTEKNKVPVYGVVPLNIFSFLKIDQKKWPARFMWWFLMIFNFSAVWQVFKILKKEKPQVVCTHNLVGLSFLLPYFLQKTKKIKHIHVIHDIQLAYPNGQLFYKKEKTFLNNFFLRRLYEKLNSKLFASPDLVISPSAWLLDFYKTRGFFKKSKIEVLANPFPSVVLKKERNISKDKKINFLFVGRVEKYKGVFLLLDIFDKFVKKNKNVFLNVVGQGPGLEKLKTIYAGSNNIFFKGHLSGEKLEQQYQDSDVLITPTLVYENFPTVILESLAGGIPVIASKIGGIPEMVDENKTGWLVEPASWQELFEVLEKVEKNRQKLSKMSENCQKQAQKYSREDYLKKLLKRFIDL